MKSPHSTGHPYRHPLAMSVRDPLQASVEPQPSAWERQPGRDPSVIVRRLVTETLAIFAIAAR
ncbi:MAG: hypothetical protein HYU53_08910 [Acidobacteria bacterium]|nr:hypothetical protein [Acidobacteriota bacterium]